MMNLARERNNNKYNNKCIKYNNNHRAVVPADKGDLSPQWDGQATVMGQLLPLLHQPPKPKE